MRWYFPPIERHLYTIYSKLFSIYIFLYAYLTMHGMLAVGEELRQSPEGILLIQVHEQDGSDLTHTLAVTHLLGEERRERDTR